MDEDFEFEEPRPKSSSNRTFKIALIALGGLLAISIICLALYLLMYVPMREQASINGTATAIAATQIAQVQPSDTPKPTATLTPSPTNTTIPVLQPTATGVVAVATETPTIIPTIITPVIPTPTPTALPATGFADEMGLPQLVIVALSLAVIILVARRIRSGITS